MNGLKVFCGSADRPLAQAIADRLDIELGQVMVTTFKDGEIRESVLERVVVTNTIPITQIPPDDKIVVLSVAPLLAEAIARIHENRSVSALFE